MIIFGAILSYLLGSIPSAVWYGKIFYKVDIRTLGSGNAGATNTLRNLGKTAGLTVLIIDLAKGFLAVKLVDLLSIAPSGFWDVTNLKFLFGVLAVAGHIFPIFANFRGGKGVATALGVLLAICPLAALATIGVFGLTLLLTRYVSLGSILGAVVFPLAAMFICPAEEKMKYLIWGSILACIIIVKHKKNIGLLMRGQENKLGQKK